MRVQRQPTVSEGRAPAFTVCPLFILPVPAEFLSYISLTNHSICSASTGHWDHSAGQRHAKPTCDNSMENSRQIRHRLFVDPEVQAALLLRVVTYWMVCLAAVALMLLCRQIVAGPPRPVFAHLEDLWFRFGPPFFASLVVLPLILMDIIRLSNRFSGPLIRLRRAMRALARGETVSPLRFRQGDFWKSFADEFNAVAERVAELERLLQTDAIGSEKPARNPSLPAESKYLPAKGEHLPAEGRQAAPPPSLSGPARPIVFPAGQSEYVPPSFSSEHG